MGCNYQNGEFYITFSSPGTMSVIKKIMNIAVSKFTPNKYYQKYSHNIKLINGRPYKSEFLWCCNKFNKSTLQFFIIGKINITPVKFRDMVMAVNTKFPKIPSSIGDRPMSMDKKHGNSVYPTSLAGGYNALFVIDFIKNEYGFPVSANSGKVIVYNKKWNILSKKVTMKQVNKFVSKKYVKLGEKFMPLMLMSAVSDGLLDTDNMIKLHKESPDSAKVVEVIYKIN